MVRERERVVGEVEGEGGGREDGEGRGKDTAERGRKREEENVGRRGGDKGTGAEDRG